MLTLPMKPTEWAAILNSVLFQREVEILGVVDDGTDWNIRYRAALAAVKIQVHVQSSESGKGGETYDADNYVSSTEADCRAELVQDLALTLLGSDTYTVFFIPVQYNAAGTKVLYDGVSAEDRMVFISQSLTNLSVSGDLYVDTINELTPGAGVTFPDRTYFTNVDDVDLVGISGALVVGGDGTGIHLALDANEVQAKTDPTTAASLFLNSHGGDIVLGDSSDGALLDVGTALQPRTDGALSLGVTGNRWGAAWMAALAATTGTFSALLAANASATVVGTTKLGDGGTTDYTEFEADGTMEFNGAATVWDDLRVPLSTAKRIGNSDPDWEVFKNGVYALAFAAGTDQEVMFSVQMPHGWKVGSDLHPHVHWAPSTTDTGSVTWKLEYTIANINGTFGATATLDVTDAGDGTAYKHQYADLGNIDMSGYSSSSDVSIMLMCRLYRDVDDGDDYADDAFALEIDFHYEINTVGSRQETIK